MRICRKQQVVYYHTFGESNRKMTWQCNQSVLLLKVVKYLNILFSELFLKFLCDLMKMSVVKKKWRLEPTTVLSTIRTVLAVGGTTFFILAKNQQHEYYWFMYFHHILHGWYLWWLVSLWQSSWHIIIFLMDGWQLMWSRRRWYTCMWPVSRVLVIGNDNGGAIAFIILLLLLCRPFFLSLHHCHLAKLTTFSGPIYTPSFEKWYRAKCSKVSPTFF